MYTLNNKITIAEKQFSSIANVEVKRSVYELSATATIKVPVTAVLRREGEPPAIIPTASAIKVGDTVTIELGYNGNLETEFIGYVKSVNLASPVEIVCEDEFYQLRKKTVKLGGKTTLADLLDKCGLDVVQCEKLTLKNFAITGKSTPTVSAVIGKLHTDYGLNMFFGLDEKFYAVRPGRMVGKTVKYTLRQNVINDDKLVYRNASDIAIEIEAICYKKDGTQVKATKGVAGGAKKTRYFYDVEDMEELAVLADVELDRASYDGYEGDIETFLEPYALPTMIADIKDPVYNERDGKYYIEAVNTTFGMSGARRVVTLGRKM